jgi:homoserine dehydrogenase
MVAPLKVGIAGLGTVGAEVVLLIEEQGRALSARSGRGVRVVAVTARSKAKKRSVNLNSIAWAKNPLELASDHARPARSCRRLQRTWHGEDCELRDGL